MTLAPALTRIAFDLGLGAHVAGVTSFCRLPPGERRPVVGSALGPRVEPILAVRPDLVLIQMEPRHLEALARLKPGLPIEHFRLERLADVGEAMERIGRLAGAPETGVAARERFERLLEDTARRTRGRPPRRALFVIGFQDPLGAGRGTFLHEMIALAGGENVLAGRHEGWRRTSLEVLIALDPEVILCHCEPVQAETARAYWLGLGGPRTAARKVVILSEPEWTVPAGHLADFTARLAEFLGLEACPVRR